LLKSIASILLCGVMSLLSGCDDKPAPPPPVNPATRPDPQQPAPPPTTQELAAIPRLGVDLQPVPVRIQAPKTWTVESLGASKFLQGQASSGLVRLRLSELMPLTSVLDPVKLQYDSYSKQREENPNVQELRLSDLGDAKMIEYREVITHGDGPSVKWVFRIYAPIPQGFNLYEIQFFDLSLAQYERDRDFLHEMMASLRFEPSLVKLPKVEERPGPPTRPFP